MFWPTARACPAPFRFARGMILSRRRAGFRKIIRIQAAAGTID
jgi:hypothetical protein